MKTITLIICIILSPIQIAAAFSGLTLWVGHHWFLTILALIIGPIPIIGTVAGIAGAITAWHWPWISAILLFFGPLLFIALSVASSEIFGWPEID